MAAVPITIVGMLYAKDKTIPPTRVSIVGVEWNPALSIGGGPVYPPAEKPPGPPTEIWPNPPEGVAPIPEHPIVIPPPPDEIPPPDQAPAKPHEGWNWSAQKSGWYYIYVPGEGEGTPKKK